MRKKRRDSDALFPLDNAGQGLLPRPPLLSPDNPNHGLHKVRGHPILVAQVCSRGHFFCKCSLWWPSADVSTRTRFIRKRWWLWPPQQFGVLNFLATARKCLRRSREETDALGRAILRERYIYFTAWVNSV